MSNDWEVTVVTDSNYLKKVRVNDCVTRADAESAALGMTGGKRVVVSNPKTYYDDSSNDSSTDSSSSSFSDSGDGLGYVILGVLVLVFMYWKIILLIGGISLVIWLLIKYAMRDTY